MLEIQNPNCWKIQILIAAIRGPDSGLSETIEHLTDQRPVHRLDAIECLDFLSKKF